MHLRRKVGRGVRLGFGLASLFFFADLTGAALAIGWLYDATLDSALLLVVAYGVAAGLGAAIGALVGGLWPERWRVQLGSRARALAGVLFVVVVAALGYGMRFERNLPERKPPAALALTHPKPVLLVVVDTLRADVLYGSDFDLPLTPNLRALAKEGVLFADMESTAGWTIPSMATLMTGIHCMTTDANAGYLPDWAPTLAEYLRAGGYETRAVVDNSLLEPRTGFAAGFEHFFQRSGLRFVFSLPSFRLIPTPWREALREHLRVFYFGARGVTDVALGELRAASDKPLFLYVHYMDPHYPYYAHPELGPDPPDGAPMAFHSVMNALREDPSVRPTEAQMRLIRARYDGEIRSVDRELGRLLDAWHARYGAESVVLFTADHGEEFLEHGGLGHGATLHREMVWVPLVWKLPPSFEAKASPGVVREPVTQLDVVPTLLDALGVDLDALPRSPVGLQGKSLWQALRRGEPLPARPLYAYNSRYGRSIGRLREGTRAYVQQMYYDGRPAERSLFDLATDPHEQHNLMSQQATASDKELIATYGSLSRALREADPRIASATHANEEALRALGYIQ